jgi:hypothetical protein
MRFLIIYLHKLVEKNWNIFDLNRYHEIQSDVRLPFSNHLDKKSLLGTWYTSLSTADKQAAVNYAYIKCYLSVTDE